MPLISTLLASLALAIPPPIPPPEPDRLAAAIELWRVRPLPQGERDGALRMAASYLATEALAGAGLINAQHYFARYGALTQRLQARAAAARESLDESTIQCLASGLAYRLTVEQLTDLRAFVATASGSAFWDYYSHWGLVECFKAQLDRIEAPFLEADLREARRAR